MPGLDLITWPYHAGLADVSMGLAASVLAADEPFRAPPAWAAVRVSV